MRTVFADACYYLALLMERDQYANQAREFTLNYTGNFLTTTAVLAEVGNSLARTVQRMEFAPLVELLSGSEHVLVIHASSGEWDRAKNLYHERPDKSWSLTDCLSFIAMQDRELTEALTISSRRGSRSS
jgi:uncharacterized protein